MGRTDQTRPAVVVEDVSTGTRPEVLWPVFFLLNAWSLKMFLNRFEQRVRGGCREGEEVWVELGCGGRRPGALAAARRFPHDESRDGAAANRRGCRRHLSGELWDVAARECRPPGIGEGRRREGAEGIGVMARGRSPTPEWRTAWKTAFP